MNEKLKTFFGLPSKINFCTNCVISNQRPSSTIELKNKADCKKLTMQIDNSGICDACKQAYIKENNIDWIQRELELQELLDSYRRNDGYYDCIVPGSGGKDSAMAAHILKYKYGMNPLTVMWDPILPTEYGRENFKNWLDIGGFDNITFNRNGKIARILTTLAFKNLLHPFQPFIIGQKNFPVSLATKYQIPLIFYGENEAEYGNPIADNATSIRDRSFHSYKDVDNLYISGVPIKRLNDEYNVKLSDIISYLPPTLEQLEKLNVEVRYLGYYVKWNPQEAYYYAVENCGFKARPFRSEGTYSKYVSIDDKIDDLNFYTTYIKFGIGRASYDASQEIRNKHITREEGVALVNKYDGEVPQRYLSEILSYLGLSEEEFNNYCDKFRSPHLWGKDISNQWKLRHNVANTGLDD
jgi:N-acetyl sugar amidotransferase